MRERPVEGRVRALRARRVRRGLHGLARPLRLRGQLGALHRGAHGGRRGRVRLGGVAGGAALYLPWLDFPRHLPPGLAEYARDWLEHPNRRPWRLDEVHGQVEVPNLDFSGWYDHCNGSHAAPAAHAAPGPQREGAVPDELIAGPWNHPGLGRRGRWRSTDTWPPGETTPREYRLGSGGDAGFGGSGRLEVRGDILCYRTEPLSEAVEIAGYPEAVLFVSSSAPDTDFFARLVCPPPQLPRRRGAALAGGGGGAAHPARTDGLPLRGGPPHSPGDHLERLPQPRPQSQHGEGRSGRRRWRWRPTPCTTRPGVSRLVLPVLGG